MILEKKWSVRQAISADLRGGGIRLADGRIIHSKGIGPIRFLSNRAYVIEINDVLFVPSLTASLFALNRFAHERRNTFSETVEFPLR